MADISFINVVYGGDNSFLAVSSFLAPEDGELLLQEAQKLTEPVELIATIINFRDGYRNIYLRMECSDETEDGMSYALVNFEVFNRNPKRSDTGIEMLGIIGSCIGNLLCQMPE